MGVQGGVQQLQQQTQLQQQQQQQVRWQHEYNHHHHQQQQQQCLLAQETYILSPEQQQQQVLLPGMHSTGPGPLLNSAASNQISLHQQQQQMLQYVAVQPQHMAVQSVAAAAGLDSSGSNAPLVSLPVQVEALMEGQMYQQAQQSRHQVRAGQQPSDPKNPVNTFLIWVLAPTSLWPCPAKTC
jgi:hypothetical protein